MIYDWTEYIYQVDDANIDCWMILVTTCDPYIHEYRNPCDIVEQCLDNLWRPAIDRCEMVNDIPWAAPGAFLRVDNTGNCVEWIDPDTVFGNYNTDMRVAVSQICAIWNIGGFLEDILISTDWSIDITTIGCKLDLSSNWPDSFLDLTDTPWSYVGHDGDILKVSWTSVVFVPDDKSQRCVRYLPATQLLAPMSPSNIKRHPLDASYREGNPAMPWQAVYPDWTFYYIEVQKTGMYSVWFNWWLYINAGVWSIKMSVMTSEGWDKAIILSSKNWVVPQNSIVDTDRWEEHIWLHYSERGLFKLTAGTRVLFLVRVDSWSGAGIDTEIEVEWRTLYSGSLAGTGWDDRAYKYCGTQFGVAWYSELTHNAV